MPEIETTQPCTPPPLPKTAGEGRGLLLTLLVLPWGIALAIAVALVAGVDMSALVDTASPGCFFYRWTGLSCPGCGGTRAAMALFRGDVIGAFAYNLFWLPSILVLLFEYVQGWRRYLRKPSIWPRLHAKFLMCYGWAVVLWFVGRNIFGI